MIAADRVRIRGTTVRKKFFKEKFMKKKLLVVLLAVISAFCLSFVFAACGGDKENNNQGNNQGGDTHNVHKYDKQVVQDKYLKSAATCTQKAIYYYSCECGEKGEQTFEYGELADHDFTNGDCVCGVKKPDSPHTHDWLTAWEKDDTHHWHNCQGCDEKNSYADHDFTNGDCVCGAKKPEPPHTHDWLTAWEKDDTYHWHSCQGCDEKNSYAEHDFANGDCVCGAKKPIVDTAGLTYEIVDNYAVVTGLGVATDSYIVIANFYQGKPVTTIGDSAFRRCDSLTSVIIPDGVTTIGEDAFYGCSSLKSITISDSVTAIGDSAFSGCSSLTSVTIPGSVTSIGDRAFSGCSSLKSITLPDSVTSIGDSAFSGCSSLKSITIPDSVTAIGEGAFSGCSSLKSVTIPDSVTSIGYIAFGNCDLLLIYCETANKPSGWYSYWNTDYPVIWDCNNNDKDEDGYAYAVVDGIRYKLKDGVATVVRQPTNIAVANIPEKVTYKESEYNVTSIGRQAFYECSSLASIIIPEGVTSIGYGAFFGCNSLTSITIPDSVTYIENAFFGCDSLTSIEVSENNKNYKSIEGNLYSKDGKQIIQYAIGKKENSFTIPDGVTTIREDAFYGCYSLTSITIPDSVTSIGYRAFEFCSSLTSITIPDSVTTIREDAFSGCDSLTIYCETVYKPSGWDSYWNGDSYWNTNYPVIWDYNNNDKDKDGYAYAVVDGIRYSLKDGVATVVRQPINIAVANIPEKVTYKESEYNVTSIGSQAFYGCYSLTSITIPDSVTSIGDRAFEFCRSLTSITIPDSVTSIGDRAFSGCDSLTIYCETANKPSGWYSYWNTDYPVIWDCNNNDKDEDGYAYAVVDGIRYSLKDGIATVVGQPINITIANIPEKVTYKKSEYNVTSIGNLAFEFCRSLTSVTIPDSVTSISWCAFSYCSSLTSIIIPEGVTSIGDRAFSGCSSLTSIIIPEGVTSIGEYAFDNCDSLTIYCETANKPSGWSNSWNIYGCPVVWGFKPE